VRRFWSSVVRPLLDVVRPEVILEIGAAGGGNTRRLAQYALTADATLHVIEPEPRFDGEAFVRDFGVVLHQNFSLRVLPSLTAVDVALVDGDHNWYTVYNELRELQRAARAADRSMPIVLSHDVAWPYARRDLYYFPETIPDEYRHPWETNGVVANQSPLAPEGRNAGLANAVFEGGPRNGVLTAIEDFLAEADEVISMHKTSRDYGLAVLVPKTRSPDGEVDLAVERLLAAERTGDEKAPRRSPSPATRQAIPKVIHHLWLGPDPVGESLTSYVESWRRHHPEWELRLWRDENLPELSLSDVLEQLDDERWRKRSPHTPGALKTWRARYDIIRLELLRQFGGVIVDLDVEAIRPLEPLLPGVTAFAGRSRDSQALKIGNQVLGAIPKHPFLEHACAGIRKRAPTAGSANELAGHSFLTAAINERLDEVTIFPRETFYSPLTIEPPRRPQDFPRIYAVHHHLQSYLGEEGEVTRYERNLRRAQGELEKLYARTDRLEAENERLRSRLGASEQRGGGLNRELVQIEGQKDKRRKQRHRK
jgi:hypothetical protein